MFFRRHFTIGGSPDNLAGRISVVASGGIGSPASTTGIGHNGRTTFTGARTTVVAPGNIGPRTNTAGMGFNGGATSTGAAARLGVGRGEEQGAPPSPKKQNHHHQQPRQQQQQQQEERWSVGAYVVMSGSVDLFLLER